MNSKFERFISNTFCNIGQSFYDSYVEANVSFRSSLGMKNVIIRRQLGNCCKWCASLSGIYDATNMPDNIRENIYRRHSNCRCLVTYKSDKGYQNVWSKKEYKKQRDSRIDRLKEIAEDELKYEKFARTRRILKNQGKWIYDATDEWYEMAKPETATIIDKDWINIDGVKYIVDNHHVYSDLSEYEKSVLTDFIKIFGGRLQYHPRIVFPESIKTADCLFNGVPLDLKSIGLRNHGIVGKNLLFNSIQKQEKQAKWFIFDISNSGLSRDDAIVQAEKLFFRGKTKYIDVAILYDGEFFKILEKIK